MKILVTGGTGFIGREVVRMASTRGFRVLALARRPLPANASNPREFLACDLSVADKLILEGLGIDAVVHLATALAGTAEEQEKSGIDGTRNLLNAMRTAGIRKLVGVSSIAVLDYVAQPPMSIIDECVPLCSDVGRQGVYASIKARQERMFASFGAEPGNHCVILRPALVYDDKHLINAHAGVIKGPLAILVDHRGEVPVVSVEGVAAAILDAIEQDIASGQIIQLVDDALPGLAAYRAGLRRRGVLPEHGFQAPWRILKLLAAAIYPVARLTGLARKIPQALLPQGFAARMKPFRYSNAKAKLLLGWIPGKRFS